MRRTVLVLIALMSAVVVFSAPPPTGVTGHDCHASAQTVSNTPPGAPSTSTLASQNALAVVLQKSLPAGSPPLPVAADGSRDPEKIPIALAYRHLIRFLAVPDADPPPDLVARRDNQLSQIGLPPGEREAALSALKGVRQELDAIEEEGRSLDTAGLQAGDRRAQLVTQLRDRLDRAGEQLRGALSSESAARLDAYVRDHVRSRIIIYGTLPQEAPSSASFK